MLCNPILSTLLEKKERERERERSLAHARSVRLECSTKKGNLEKKRMKSWEAARSLVIQPCWYGKQIQFYSKSNEKSLKSL